MKDYMDIKAQLGEPLLDMSRASGPDGEPSPPGAEPVLLKLQKAPQQEWLDSIAGIVKLGDIKLALYLLLRYQQKFGE